MRQIVLDTETTGLHIDQGHRIIEIGCVELIDRKLTGKHFHQYINPQREIDEGALAVHGISQDFLSDKPFFDDIAEQFMAFVNGAELIIHNAPFDVGFINAELKLIKRQWKLLTDHCQIVDSLIMARQMHTGQRNSLDALCKRYSIDNSQRELHGALLDAHLLSRVYLAMTGGQATLFGAEETAEIATQQQSNVTTPLQRSPRQLVVIMADAGEITSHEVYLQQMQKKGKCLWMGAYASWQNSLN
jgi:DNA polymerase-3 subunit epsilon